MEISTIDSQDSSSSPELSIQNRGSVKALENALVTVQAGVDLMKDIITEYKNLYQNAPTEERKVAFTTLLRSPMYENFTKATADSAAARNLYAKMLSESVNDSQKR